MSNTPDNNPTAWEATLVDPRLKDVAAPMTPEKARQWRANSGDSRTRGSDRAGTSSLDSVHVDATKDPYDFSDAERLEALAQHGTRAQRLDPQAGIDASEDASKRSVAGNVDEAA